MSQLPRRPKTIWLTQIFLLLAGVPLSLVAMFGIVRYVLAVVEVETGSEAIGLYLAILLNIALIFVVIFASWGLIRRRNYGRWLSVAFVLLLMIFGVLGQVYSPKDPYGYEDPNYEMGRIIGGIMFAGLFILLLYRLVFGESVYDFFNHMEEPSASAATPPPPEEYFPQPTSTNDPSATK